MTSFHQDWFVPRAWYACKGGRWPGAAEPGKAAGFMKSCGFYIGDIPGRVSINDDAINYP